MMSSAPYDLAGHGYGHTGKAKNIGQHMQSVGTFPYRDPGNRLRDVYPELFGDGDGDEEEGASLEDDQIDAFASRLGLSHTVSDQLGQGMNVRDRSSFVGAGSRLTLAAYDPRLAVGGSLSLERIFNPSARDNPLGPRYSGTTRGWSGAPQAVPEDENDEPMLTHDAIDLDQQAVDKAQKTVRQALGRTGSRERGRWGNHHQRFM